MLRWQAWIGISLGLLVAAAVMGLFPGRHAILPPTGPMLTEADGAIRSAVIQYAHGSEFVLPVYRQFLAYMASDVTIYVACPDQSAFDELRAAVGSPACTLHPIFTAHDMTAWSRDRWVALLPARTEPASPITLLSPLGENAAEVWPARAGDSRVGDDIARTLHLGARRSALYFDGGDYLADGDLVFATPALITRNLQHTVYTRQELLATIARELDRTPVLLEGAPNHHAGMFMMAVGNKTMLVADPSRAQAFLFFNPPVPGSPLSDLLARLPGGPDFSPAMQARFDSVARTAESQGYRVVRIPVAPARDSKAYITYVNVIMDTRDNHRIVYMPTFQGADTLNAAAANVWESVGYEVRPIDCTPVFTRGGTLHCLVNVLERSPS